VPKIVLLPVNQHYWYLIPKLSVQSGVVVNVQFNEIPFAGLVTKFFKNRRDHRTGVVTGDSRAAQ
jgi:hypothetical protein